MNKFLKGLCLGIGVISLVGLVNVPVYAIPNGWTQEQWDQRMKEAEEDKKDLSNRQDNVLHSEPKKVPQNGDTKTLNVGWTNADTGIYYCKDESRVKVTGWQQIDGKWYYFDPSTYDMKTGWFNDGGNWYYLTEPSYLGEGKVKIKDGLGSMQVGWIKINGKWYYFNNDGSMKIGWLNDGDKWYYLYSDGTIATNTTIDGCTLYADGAWCEPQNNETKTISKESDFLFDAKTGTITKYVGTNTTVVIPSTINGISVKGIGKEAFEKTACTSIVIPNSVTNIEASAFMWCNKLTDITIPNSVTSIGDGAFCNCSSLKSITIPDSVTSLGEYVLGNCSCLININAGQKVKDKINSQRVIPY